MLKMVNRLFLFTSLMLGVFLTGSAFAALGSITAGGYFEYNGSTSTLTIADATVSRSDFDVLSPGDKITFTTTLGSSGRMNFDGSDVIEAVTVGNTGSEHFGYSIKLSGLYSITGGGWSEDFKTNFSSHILLMLGEGQSFSDYKADYTGPSLISLSFTSVPVPSSLTLMGLGLLILAGYLRKIHRNYFSQVFRS
nr:hypothetical protein [uncultured Desulfobacter sp.]